jgi:recombination protein RecA
MATQKEEKKEVKNDLQDLIDNITKSYGEGSIDLLNSPSRVRKCSKNRFTTGLFNLDWALGGGLVEGSQIEISGAEGHGKTTLALSILAQCQSLGMMGYIVDAEHKLNLEYAEVLGVDIKRLFITQPNWGEQALDIMKDVLTSGLVRVVVVDSVSMLVPLVDITGEFTDANMGAHPRLMSKMVRVMTPLVTQNKILIIYINQARTKIGNFFGDPETTTGGHALKHMCGMRIKVSSQQIKTAAGAVDITRRNVTLNVIKNQWGVPYRKVDEELVLGQGFNRGLDMIEYGLRMGVLTLNGSFVKFGSHSVGNGKAKAGQALLENANLRKDFMKALKEAENAESK